MDSFFLNSLDLQRFKLLIEYLTQVHDYTLVNLLPQVSSEDLDKRDFQGRDFTVHENTRQIELYLETDVDVGTIDCGTPPERETTGGNLVQTGTLGIRELLVSHGLFETRRLLPEKTLPGREVRALEQRVLKDTLDTTQSSDDIDPVVVELPQLAVVTLRGPPEGVAIKEVRRVR